MSYGNSLYSAVLFTAEDTEESGNLEEVNLMRYLPAYYQGIHEMEALQETLGVEIGSLKSSSIDVLNQAFVGTATWGLARWESELGLSTDPSKSFVSRREMIIAKLRGSGTTTPEMIQRTASAFSGGDVLLEEVPGEYRFIVRFVGILGIPPNMAGLIQMIEEIKPAHLAYDFVYTYTFWSALRSISWNTAGVKTWNELRTYG